MCHNKPIIAMKRLELNADKMDAMSISAIVWLWFRITILESVFYIVCIKLTTKLKLIIRNIY